MLELVELGNGCQAIQAAARVQHVSRNGFRRAHERFNRGADLVGGDEPFPDLLAAVRTAGMSEICMTSIREFLGAAAIEPALDSTNQSLWQAVFARAPIRIDPGEVGRIALVPFATLPTLLALWSTPKTRLCPPALPALST